MTDRTDGDPGIDVRTAFWLSESAAGAGVRKALGWDGRRIEVVIPPRSHDGLVLRLRGLGGRAAFNWRTPLLIRRRGNLLLKLHVYPDRVTPRYGAFEALSTKDMVLEGWVYRTIDRVLERMGRASFRTVLAADAVADAFNDGGWRAVFQGLLEHMQLAHFIIQADSSASLAEPGNCQRTGTIQGVERFTTFRITISDQFLANPFAVAAILAHELCHVVYAEIIDPGAAWAPGTHVLTTAVGPTLQELERTVDVLVFMFGLGEFQLRAARDTRLTIGYFSQDLFERIQVIARRRLDLE